MHPELHKELNIVSEQTDIGNMRVALQNFADRINVTAPTGQARW